MERRLARLQAERERYGLLSTDEVARAWATRTEADLRRAMLLQRIRNTGTLAGRLRHRVATTASQQSVIEFSFPTYGRFVDMGVGKGRTMRQGNRKPRRWYMVVYYRRLAVLRRLAAINVQNAALRAVGAALGS